MNVVVVVQDMNHRVMMTVTLVMDISHYRLNFDRGKKKQNPSPQLERAL